MRTYLLTAALALALPFAADARKVTYYSDRDGDGHYVSRTRNVYDRHYYRGGYYPRYYGGYYPRYRYYSYPRYYNYGYYPRYYGGYYPYSYGYPSVTFSFGGGYCH